VFEKMVCKERTRLQELLVESAVTKSFKGDEPTRKGNSRHDAQLYATRWWINSQGV
jgi:hypothetical protein